MTGSLCCFFLWFVTVECFSWSLDFKGNASPFWAICHILTLILFGRGLQIDPPPFSFLQSHLLLFTTEWLFIVLNKSDTKTWARPRRTCLPLESMMANEGGLFAKIYINTFRYQFSMSFRWIPSLLYEHQVMVLVAGVFSHMWLGDSFGRNNRLSLLCS